MSIHHQKHSNNCFCVLHKQRLWNFHDTNLTHYHLEKHNFGKIKNWCFTKLKPSENMSVCYFFWMKKPYIHQMCIVTSVA